MKNKELIKILTKIANQYDEESKEADRMSDYTKDMTVSEMREEIAEMLQSGEGFIATNEKLYEYVDDFMAKVRAEAIEPIISIIAQIVGKE